MNVLVTGGAGYIGSVIVQKLRARGDQVVVYDNLTTGFRDSLPKDLPFIEGDVRQTSLLSETLKKFQIDSVIHMAARLIVPESFEKPLEYHINNVGGTLSLLEACQFQAIKNLVFSSTATAYGNPVSCPIFEEQELRPINPYGTTKVLSEKIIQECGPRQNLNSVILRYFNVAGATKNLELGLRSKNATHLIKVASQVALGIREKLEIFGIDYPTPDGTCLRDYVHVEDLAQAHLLAIDYLSQGGSSQVLNCGYGRGLSVFDVVNVFEKILGRPLPKVISPRREGDPAQLYSNSQKIRKTLGWKPQFDSIELIVQSALNWEKKLLGGGQ